MPARAHTVHRPSVPLLQADDQIRTCYEHTMAEWLGCEAIVRQREKESHAAALAKCSSGASLDSHIQRMMHRDSTISNEVRVWRLRWAVSVQQGRDRDKSHLALVLTALCPQQHRMQELPPCLGLLGAYSQWVPAEGSSPSAVEHPLVFLGCCRRRAGRALCRGGTEQEWAVGRHCESFPSLEHLCCGRGFVLTACMGNACWEGSWMLIQAKFHPFPILT